LPFLANFRIKVMVSFLISSAIGVYDYQFGGLGICFLKMPLFRVGNSVINLAA